jgi:hypothetical protein
MFKTQSLRSPRPIALLALLTACGTQTGGAEPPETAQQSAPQQVAPKVSWSQHNDTSPPLFLIQPAARPTKFEEHEVKRLPKLPGSRVVGASADSVLQPARSVPSPLAPILGLNFDGVGQGFGAYLPCCAPPDTNGDVGLNHYVETVNLDYAVFNKTTGALVLGPVAINTLWSGFGGSCQTHNDGDPVVIYDSKADRWVVSQFAVNVNPSLQCVAVSQTSDPTGAYFRYAFSYGADFPDYPKMGVWPDAYYESFNMFNGAGTAFLGAEICAYDRSKMLTGAAATQQCFRTSTLYGGLLPSDLDGANLPPAGAPNYVVGLDAPVTSTLLQYWKFHVDWTTPANTTFTGPIALSVASYTNSCNTLARGDCIPQGGGGTNLESLADRAMYRLAYRNFGDHQALVFNHTIEVSAGASSGVRWYELRADAANNLSVFQQGTYAPDSNWRWMGSIAQDKAGNIGLGYSVSSSAISPQIHFTGRLAADPAGTMTQGENIVINGGGSQTGGLARWGDYSMMGIDPVDDCTFWYTQEYLKASGSFNWSTRINSFKLPNCGAAPTPDFSLSTSPASQTVTQGAGTSYTETITPINGFTGSVTLSVSGLPAGSSGTFSPNPATSTSTLSVTTSPTTPTGSFPLTITGVSGTLTHTSGATLVVNAAATPDFSLSATPASQTVTQGTAGSYTVNVTRTGGFTGPVTLSMSSSPAGLTGTFSPNPNTGASSSLSVPTSTSTTPGTYTITISGSGSGVPTHTTTVTLVVNAPAPPDYTLSVTPSSQTVIQGASTTYTVNITRTGGFTGGVTLSVSGLPAGAAGSFTPNPSTTASSTLTVTTATTTPTGSFALTISGTATGIANKTAPATLVVNAAACTDGNCQN